MNTVNNTKYRVVQVARGTSQINNLLARGWEILSTQFVEEIREQNQQGHRVAQWLPYAMMGLPEGVSQEPSLSEVMGAPAAVPTRAPAFSQTPAPIGSKPVVANPPIRPNTDAMTAEDQPPAPPAAPRPATRPPTQPRPSTDLLAPPADPNRSEEIMVGVRR